MNVVELSAMIQVRNHLQMLLNDRAAVPKQNVRAVQNVISDMDKKIVAEALGSAVEMAMGMTSRTNEVKAATPVPPKTVMENKAVMVVQPEDFPADLPPARPVKLGGGKKTRTPKPVETKVNE